VAAASEVVVTMLRHGREVEAVAFGPEGLAEGFGSGSLLLDTSSSEPWYTRKTAGRLAARGVAMVDAPVSGAEAGARNAELVFMVGGEPAAVERVRPVGSGHVVDQPNSHWAAHSQPPFR
jgi:3-hydroxyisobutyrate dehydrogenase-like beta-hydroxyacid dehydrogenase